MCEYKRGLELLVELLNYGSLESIDQSELDLFVLAMESNFVKPMFKEVVFESTGTCLKAYTESRNPPNHKSIFVHDGRLEGLYNVFVGRDSDLQELLK